MTNSTKTYRAPDMLSALQQIQKELGADAIVVSVRKVAGGKAWQVWRNPEIEVMAMKNTTNPQPKTKNNSAQSQPGTTQPKTPEKSAAPLISSPPEPADPLDIVDWVDIHPPVTPPARNPNPPAKTNLSVSATIQTLAQPRNTSKGNWKPYSPPKISHQQPEDDDSYLAQDGYSSGSANPQAFPAASPYPGMPANKIDSLKPAKEMYPSPKLLSKYRTLLLAQGVDAELLDQIVRTCQEILPANALEDEKRIRYLLQRQLEAEIQESKTDDGYLPSPLFIIGSSNIGKTDVCAKLAAYAGQTLNKTTSWICTNTIRTSAISETHTYCDLLNIPLLLAYTPEELDRHIHSLSNVDFILVDTPDYNPRRENSVVELGKFVTQIPSRTTYIVISATTKETDLNQAIGACKPFRVKGLIVTKMDEATTFGSVYNLARKTQIPLTYFINGSNVFNHLQPAKCQMLVDSLFGEGFAK